MIGILLCGGQSARMARDKGLFHDHGKTWAEAGLEKLATLGLPAAISINATQLESYSIISNAELIVDNPQLEVQGPLLGLLSAHLQFPDEDLLLLACDLVQMNIAVLEKLVATFKEAKPQAVAFKGKHVEPLCAIYSSQGLDLILSDFHQGRLTKFNMHLVLERLGARLLSIPGEWEKYFKNYNSPEDLE